VIDYDYSPRSITVQPGTTVVWTNRGQADHSVSSDTGAFDSSGAACSGNAQVGCLNPGESFTHEFSAPGRFAYHCRVHASMHGVVIVVASSTTAPSPAGPTTAAPEPATTTSTTAAASPVGSGGPPSGAPAAGAPALPNPVPGGAAAVVTGQPPTASSGTFPTVTTTPTTAFAAPVAAGATHHGGDDAAHVALTIVAGVLLAGVVGLLVRLRSRTG
jgi:hypothetical protein